MALKLHCDSCGDQYPAKVLNGNTVPGLLGNIPTWYATAEGIENIDIDNKTWDLCTSCAARIRDMVNKQMGKANGG